MTAQDPAHNPIAAALHGSPEDGADAPPATLRDRLSRLSDYINPVVVRCVRQRWRSWVLPVEMALMFSAGILIHRTVMLDEGTPAAERAASAFAFLKTAGLCGCLLATAAVTTGIKKELRDPEPGFALELTAVGAARYLRGRVLAILAVAAIYSLMLLPFGILAMLKGGPPPLWLLALAPLDAAAVVIFATFAVAAAALERHGLAGFVFRFWCSAASMAVLVIGIVGTAPTWPLMGVESLNEFGGSMPGEHWLAFEIGGLALLGLIAGATLMVGSDLIRPLPPGAKIGGLGDTTTRS